MPCRISFVLVVPLTLLLCAGTRTKRLPETHSWVVDAYPAAARNHHPEAFLFTARVNYVHIVILGHPFGKVCLTQSRRHGTTLACLKCPQLPLGSAKARKSQFLTAGALNFRTSFCMQLCKPHHDQLKPSYSPSGYFYLVPPQYCTFSIMSPGSNLPSLAITPSRYICCIIMWTKGVSLPPTILMARFSWGSVRLILMQVISPSGIRWYNLGKPGSAYCKVFIWQHSFALLKHARHNIKYLRVSQARFYAWMWFIPSGKEGRGKLAESSWSDLFTTNIFKLPFSPTKYSLKPLI